MSWHDTKQAAIDPDNPGANEQTPFDEWNAMVAYLKDKISNHAVNAAAIGDNKILVYDSGTGTFGYEDQNVTQYVNDLDDATIAGVADEHVLMYDTSAPNQWVNKTIEDVIHLTTAEIDQLKNIGTSTISADQWGVLGGLAGTLTAAELNYVDGVTSDIQTQLDAKAATAAVVLETDFDAGTFLYATADDTPLPKTVAQTLTILGIETGATKYPDTGEQAFLDADHTKLDALETAADLATWRAGVDSTEMGYLNGISSSIQTQLAAKAAITYADTHIVARDFLIPGSWADGHILVYRTAFGRFEMEAVSLANQFTGLTDTPASINALQLLRGNAGATELEFTGVNETDYFLKTGARALTGDMDINGNTLDNLDKIISEDGNGVIYRNYTDTEDRIALGRGGYAFIAYTQSSMMSNRLSELADGIDPHDAANHAQACTRYIQVMIVDPNTALAAGTKKAIVHIPFAGTLTGVHAEVGDASDSAVEIITLDIEKNGSTVLSTLLTIDKDETGSDTATTAAVISDSAIAANDVYTFDVDLVGANAKGLTVTCTVVVT